MPIYEYCCEKCGNKFEELTLSMNSKSKVKCPKCGGNAGRQVSTFSAQSNSDTNCQLPDGSCGMNPGGGCAGGGCPFSA